MYNYFTFSIVAAKALDPFAESRSLYLDYIPTQKDVEEFLVRRRKQELIDKYVGSE
jgi:hypothetical protein